MKNARAKESEQRKAWRMWTMVAASAPARCGLTGARCGEARRSGSNRAGHAGTPRLAAPTCVAAGGKKNVARAKGGIFRREGLQLARATGVDGVDGPAPDLELDFGAMPFEYYTVSAVVREWKATAVADALQEAGIVGMTLTSVQGLGMQAGEVERERGCEVGESSLVRKTKIDVTVCAAQAADVVNTVQEAAWTGEYGDGKIFLLPVLDLLRVRTGERGAAAERMVGGREDRLTVARTVAEDFCKDHTHEQNDMLSKAEAEQFVRR